MQRDPGKGARTHQRQRLARLAVDALGLEARVCDRGRARDRVSCAVQAERGRARVRGRARGHVRDRDLAVRGAGHARGCQHQHAQVHQAAQCAARCVEAVAACARVHAMVKAKAVQQQVLVFVAAVHAHREQAALEQARACVPVCAAESSYDQARVLARAARCECAPVQVCACEGIVCARSVSSPTHQHDLHPNAKTRHDRGRACDGGRERARVRGRDRGHDRVCARETLSVRVQAQVQVQVQAAELEVLEALAHACVH